MQTVFTHFLTQVLSTVGVIFVFGLLIALLSRLFYANMGERAPKAALITGFLGTPLHECAHALFCLIFLHKITDMKLFEPDPDEETIGYVQHTYNPRNIYQRIGNFFIGIAPIVVITAVLYFLARWLLPEMIDGILAHVRLINVQSGVGDIFSTLWEVIKTFFGAALSFEWWIFLLISFSLVLHMNLSPADIKGSLFGLFLLLVLLLIVNTLLYFISVPALGVFTSWFITGGSFMAGFLSLSLIVSAITAVLSLPFRFF